MTIKPAESTVVIRAPKMIFDGLVMTREAFIEMDASQMRQDFLQMFVHYHDKGLIRVRVAEIKGEKQ